MKNKEFEELWSEFLSLGWEGNDPKSTWNTSLVDLQLFPKIFLRRWEGAWIIQFLPFATKLIIPAPWPLMWSEFNTWSGGSMVELLKSKLPIKSKVEYFGRIWFGIVSHIERKLCGSPEFEKIWEEELGKILTLGTRDFRTWMKEEHNIKLEPWIYENLEERKEI